MNHLLPAFNPIRIAAFIFILFASAGCSTEDNSNFLTCGEFRQALIMENETVLAQEVNAQIAALPSKAHTLQNLRNLNARFNDQGCTPVGTYCFACLYSNPPVSEIQVSFTENGTTISKSIYIGENTRGEMVFRGLHP